MTVIGYARVSTEEQNLDLQIDALKAFGCSRIYQEKTSGVSKKRKEFDKMRKSLKEGDTLVVWKLDRLGRSTTQLFSFIDELEENNVEFVSLQDSIDTTTSMGKAMQRIMGVMAEMEHDLIVERTNAGLAAARRRGRKGGRPAADPDKVNLALRMKSSGEFTVREICEACDMSQGTLYKYVNAEKEKDEA